MLYFERLVNLRMISLALYQFVELNIMIDNYRNLYFFFYEHHIDVGVIGFC